VRLLIGLGNPGTTYENTRHNIGFRFLDYLAALFGLRFGTGARFRAETASWHTSHHKVLLAKPQTFMNDSGEAVAALAHYYGVDTSRIYVVHDDIDLPPGKVRLRAGGGHGGHNGLKSLHAHLPDSNYRRIKIGIGRPERGGVTAWVLGTMSREEKRLEARVFDAIASEIDTILQGDLPAAANRIHLRLVGDA